MHAVLPQHQQPCLGGRIEFDPLYFMRRVWIFQHNNTTRDRRLGRPPTIEFRHRSDSQSLGTGCGIRRQILFFNAHVSSSINPFSLSTYFCYPKGIHPKATLCTQMLLHHWVCQSLVTNQPLTFTLSSTSWAVQPNTATSSSHNNCWTCKIHS